MKKFLFLIALFTLFVGANSVKAEKFVSLGSVLTLAEAEAASTSGTGVAIVYDNSKLFANNTGGDPGMSLVDVNSATRGYMFKISERVFADEVQYYRIQCYNPNSTLIAAGDAAGAYGDNILSPVSWGSVWASSILGKSASESGDGNAYTAEEWDGRDFKYGAQWCFESDGAGGYYIKTRSVGSTKPYLSSSGNMTDEANKASYKFYSLVEIAPYTLEWTPNAGTYRATIPLSESYIRTTGDVSINYSTGEVTNTGSGKLIIYLNNENLVGATGYNLKTSGDGLLGSTLDITDAVNGEVGGIYGSRNSWYIAGDGSRKDKIGAVKAFTYNFSGGTGSQTITSIYFDADLLVAQTTTKDLTSMPYGEWTVPASTLGTYISDDAYMTNNIDGKSHDGLLYGHDGNGDASKYVDLTNCSKIIFTGLSSNGAIRLFYNWSGTDADKPIQTINDFPTTSGTYTFDIDAFKKSKGLTFFHLNGIKTNWGDATLSSVKVVEYSNVISGSGIDKTKVYLSNPYITSIDATGVTATGVNLNAENPNVLFTANSGKLSNTKNVIVSGTCDNLELSDGNYSFKASADFTATSASYDRTFTEDQPSTVCLPFALTEAEVTAAGTFYELTSYSEGTLTFTQVDATDAYKPYLFKAAKANPFSGYSDKAIDATPADLSVIAGDATMTGTMARQSVNGKYGWDSADGAFSKATSYDVTIDPFRAYITISGESLARVATLFVDSSVTGINEVSNSEDVKSAKNFEGKVFENGKIYIFKKGMKFNAAGAQVK